LHGGPGNVGTGLASMFAGKIGLVYSCMAEEKKKAEQAKEPRKELHEEAQKPEKPEEKKTPKVSLLARLKGLKKFALPALSALGAFAVSSVIYMFVLSDKPSTDGTLEDSSDVAVQEVKTEPADQTAAKADKKRLPGRQDASKPRKDAAPAKEKKFSKEDVDAMEIDTTEIMKELEFLFATPEMDAAALGLTPEDSLDTLNWIQKEMAKLDKARTEQEKRMKELQALEYKIDQCLVKIEQAESTRIAKLARLYDGMKAAEVAKLFANLDDNTILSVLPRMKPANASKILGLIPPKRAARISTRMITVLEN
jgi:flagellar motility protein MotE (MotC chaperone)